MSDREKTCEERIAGQLARRLEAMHSYVEPHDEGDKCQWCDGEHSDDEHYDRHAEYLLSIESYRTVRIDLSTGGPGDWFEVQLDSDNEPRRIEYHFNDWFDHAARTLDGDEYDAAWAFLEPYCEAFE